MEKPYAVVYFFEQNSYSEIPSNWLLDTDKSTGVTECKWPPSYVKNLNYQFKNRTTPTSDWPIYKVKLMRYWDTLIQARKAAEDSDYSSASEIPLGKGHRSKFLSPAAAAVATSKYTSNSDDISSDDENDNGKKPAAEMPKMDKKIQKAPISTCDSNKSNGDDGDGNGHFNTLNGNDGDGNGCFNTLNGNDDNGNGRFNTLNGNDGDGNGRFNTLNDKLDSCLKLLGTLVVEIKDLNQRIVANDEANNCMAMNKIELQIKNHLPLNSREEVSAFNAKLLESKDYHQEFVKFIKQVGGVNGKDYTERVLNTIFSTSFAADNSWEGKKTKFKLSDLKVIKICEEVILKKFTSWDRVEFAKAGTNWFRLGNQRAGLQKGQIQKQIH